MKDVLKATGLMGSSALAKLLVGVASAKVVALLMGPSGISTLAQLQYVVAITTLIATLGMNTSIVSEVGQVETQTDDLLTRIWGTSSIITWIVSLCLAVAMWSFRTWLAELTFGDAALASYIGLVALAIPLAAIAAMQIGLLNGLRQIKDMAQITIVANVASMIVTVALVWLLREVGLFMSVLAVPMISVWFGHRCIKRSMPAYANHIHPRRFLSLYNSTIARRLVVLGGTVMLTALLAQGTQFVVRIWLLQHLGVNANGQFQAAWTISIGYMSLVLYAMGVDYYPRLVQTENTPEQISLVINQQLRIAILLLAPVAISLMVFSQIAVHLLYSADFTDTPTILRWQIIGDMFKVISWTFGFVLLAARRNIAYFLVELLWNVLFLVGVILLAPRYGIVATGIAFLGSYVAYAAITYALVVKTAKFRISYTVIWTVSTFGLLISLILLINVLPSSLLREIGLTLIVICAAAYSIWTLEREVHLFSAITNRFRSQSRTTLLSKDNV